MKKNNKMKLLYLYQILYESTDQDNPFTVKEMIEELELYGVKSERKSIYSDLRLLEEFGVNIETNDSKKSKYYIADRLFEIAELKLLVDAVKSSKFITYDKSCKLIKKLSKLTSKNQAKLLNNEMYIGNRNKIKNECIYYNVDTLHQAIIKNKKVVFKYFDFNIKKEKIYRKEGDLYTVSPYELSWGDENYYLITYSNKYEGFANYRVDKMDLIEMIDEDRDALNSRFDIAEYTKKIFSMFSGEEEMVQLQFNNDLIQVVFDKFGNDVQILEHDNDSFFVFVKIVVSPTFFGWIAQLGRKVKIIGPELVVKEYLCHLDEIQDVYHKKSVKF